MNANDTVTGRLFARFAPEGQHGMDFNTFVHYRRQSFQWPDYELALSIKERLQGADARIEDILRDMNECKWDGEYA